MTRKIAAIACLSIAGGITVFNAAGPVTLAVPGRVNANISIAAQDRFVVAAWSASTADGSQTDIQTAVSRDGGRTFAPPPRRATAECSPRDSVFRR